MTNVLMCYICEEPTNLMLGSFFEEIEKKGIISLRRKYSMEVGNQDIEWADIVIGIRVQDLLTASILKIAKKYGRFVLFFVDDDFFSLKDHKIRRALEEKYLLQSLKIADVIASSNDKLAYRMCERAGCNRRTIVETAIMENELKQPTVRERDEIRIAYYSNDGSKESFETIIAPILNDLVEITKKRIRLSLYTVKSEIKETDLININYINRLPLEEFRQSLRSNNYDIGIAPLLESEFNSCKYVNKFMEFSRAGIPCIYSNVSPYKEFINDGENGTKANNDRESWLNAFLINMDVNYRKKCIEGAQTQIREKYSYDEIISTLINDVPELKEFKATSCKVTGLTVVKYKSLCSKFFLPITHAIGRARVDGIGSVFSWTFGHYLLKKK